MVSVNEAAGRRRTWRDESLVVLEFLFRSGITSMPLDALPGSRVRGAIEMDDSNGRTTASSISGRWTRSPHSIRLRSSCQLPVGIKHKRE